MKNTGFTLIEILIVISIIGVLTGISIFGLKGAREAGRDTRRKADLESIRSALEMYKADNGTYPAEAWCDSSIGSAGSACPPASSAGDWNGTIATELEPDYISNLPVDPINDSTYYYYYEPACNQANSVCGLTTPCPTPPGGGTNCCSYWLWARMESDGSDYRICNP